MMLDGLEQLKIINAMYRMAQRHPQNNLQN